jgi:DNA-binding transcriptional LysR family regulator
MVSEGLGIALLPRPLVQREIDTGALLELQSDWTAEPLRFFARYDPTRAARFVEHAAEIAAQLRPHEQ